MVGGNVIDLTGDDAQEHGFIDLTRDSSSPPSRTKPRSSGLTNGHHEEDTRQLTGTNRRRRNRKIKKPDTQELVSTEPEPSGGKSLLQRIQPPASETNQGSTSSTKIASKRKRRESVDSSVSAHVEARPPKRHKSKTPSPVPPNEEMATPKDSKKKKRSKNKSRQASVDRQAPSASLPERPIPQAGSSSSQKKSSNSRSKKQNRSSQSPIPSTNGQSSSRKHKSTARARSTSIPSILPSPALSASALFFVDTAPNAENKHVEDVPKPAYRMDGDLLLPQHVLLESADEVVQTPDNDIYPPPTPALSEGSIDVVDDSLRVSRAK
jgi:hypothetical protein